MPELALATTQQLFTAFDSARFKQKLAAVIPETLRPDRMIQLAVTLIKSNKWLMQCRPITLYACVVECAQLGLELDNILGHAYLVPFKDVCTLIIGYRGFCHLAYQSGQVASISAEVVRPRDKFTVQFGSDRKIVHLPVAIKDQRDRDPDAWVGAYAVAKQVNGAVQFEWMERDKIEASRARSQSWRAFMKDPEKQTPWDSDAEEMWRKTPVRRLAKLLPRSTTDKRQLLLRAAMIDEYGERGLLEATEEGFITREQPANDEPPLQPTLEAQLQESIEIADAKKDKPGREKKKPTKEAPKEKAAGPPSAAIPPSGAPPKIDDPVLTVTQQTAIFNAAFQAGWKVPEELNVMFQKVYKVKTVRDLRNSQFAEVLEKVKSGT